MGRRYTREATAAALTHRADHNGTGVGCTSVDSARPARPAWEKRADTARVLLQRRRERGYLAIQHYPNARNALENTKPDQVERFIRRGPIRIYQ
jgi:hypothetical protein